MSHVERIDDWYDPRRYAEVVQSIWSRHFGLPKVAARALRQTERAARMQLTGDSGPQGHTIFNAMKNAAILADILRELGHDDLAMLAESKAARQEALAAVEDQLLRARAHLRGDAQ